MIFSKWTLDSSPRKQLAPFQTNLSPATHEVRRAICSTCVRRDQRTDAPDKPKVKPNLKQAGRFGNSHIIVAACILAGLYMYPMIFKPLLGFGTSAEEQGEKMRMSGLDLSKTRPSNMPEWTSPFGPRKSKDDD